MFNDVLNLAMDIIPFKSVFGDYREVGKCVDFIEAYARYNNLIYQKFINKRSQSPVIVISNKNKRNFDIMSVGHADVVYGKDDLFIPRINGDFLYGRGAYDMKTGVAINLELVKWAKNQKKDISIGTVISFDEEIFSENSMTVIDNLGIKSKVILDNDAGASISGIVEKTKNNIYSELVSEKVYKKNIEHWKKSFPLKNITLTLDNIRKIIPEYSGGNYPAIKPIKNPRKRLGEIVPSVQYWTNFMSIQNIGIYKDETDKTETETSFAELHFELIDGLSSKELKKIIKPCLVGNTQFTIQMERGHITESRKNPILKKYKNLVELEADTKISWVSGMNGACNSMMIKKKHGATVIRHSYSGGGYHADHEHVDLRTVKQLCNIQQRFVDLYIKDKEKA